MNVNARKFDWPLLIVALLLSIVGLISIINIKVDSLIVYKQTLFIGVGFILYIVFSFINYRYLNKNAYILIILYLLSALSLIGVVFVGFEVHQAKSWFKVGEFSIQPVEFAKLILIFILAKYFSIRHVEMYSIRHFIVSGIYVGILSILVLMQPDFGSVFVLIMIWRCIMFLAGINKKHVLILLMLSIVIGTLGWVWYLEDYQKERILTFINPYRDTYGQSYNIYQSLIAVGSGGFRGLGLSGSTQSQLNFLPEKETDFIFAAYAEQWGFVGVFILLTLYLILLWRIIKLALDSNNNFSRLYASGVAILIFIHIMINVSMNLAMFPIVGLPLPFISYGGSSLITIFIALGVLNSIKIRANK